METAERINYTVSEYFEFEESQEGKFEYHNGEIVAMAGASKKHSIISINLQLSLRIGLKGSGCRVYNNDVKVTSEKYNSYYYPDGMVVCEDSKNDSETIETEPVLIFEVLSDSTEKFDRSGKWDTYRSIPSLQAYLLVSQYKPQVEIFTRTPHGEFWKYQSIDGLEGEVEVESLNLKLKLAEIYESISFDK